MPAITAASPHPEENSPAVLRKRLATTRPSTSQKFMEDLWKHAESAAEVEVETNRVLYAYWPYKSMSFRFPTHAPTRAQTTRPIPPTPRPTQKNIPTHRPSAAPSSHPTRTAHPTRHSPVPQTIAPTKARSSKPSLAPTTRAPVPPTLSPSQHPSSSPTVSCLAGTPKETFLLRELSQVTPEAVLLDPTTPQGMAFSYMNTTDPYLRANPCLNPTLQQRYGLITIYFATGGPTWTRSNRWLGNTMECLWYGVVCDVVTQRVQKLQLCKFSFSRYL